MRKTTDTFLYVRIVKPTARQKYRHSRRYMVFGIRFDEAKGWYRVPATMDALVSGQQQAVDMGKFLSEIRENDDPDSPLVFEVCSETRALEIQAQERRRHEERPAEVADLRTSDFPQKTRERVHPRP